MYKINYNIKHTVSREENNINGVSKVFSNKNVLKSALKAANSMVILGSERTPLHSSRTAEAKMWIVTQ